MTDDQHPAQQLVEAMVARGEALVRDLMASTSLVALVGRLGNVGRRDLQLIGVWVVVREVRKFLTKELSDEEAKERFKGWLLADGGEAMLAEFSLDPEDQAPAQGRQRRGGRKRRKR